MYELEPQPEGVDATAAYRHDQAARLEHMADTIGSEGDYDGFDQGDGHIPYLDIDTEAIGVDEALDGAMDDAGTTYTDDLDSTALELGSEGGDAVGDGGAGEGEGEGESAEPGTPADTDVPDEATAEHPGTPSETALPKAEILDRFTRWKRGEAVESSSAPIASVAVTDTENAVLGTISIRYHDVKPDAVRDGITDKTARRETQLTIPQSRVVHDISGRFLTAVQEDAARNGYGEVGADQYKIRVGSFYDHDTLRPHADPFTTPTVRYVMTIGNTGTTQFTHGPIQQHEVNKYGFVSQEAAQRMSPDTHTTVSYEPGVVARFLGSHDIHATPTTPGPRLFFSITIELEQDELKP